MTKLVNESQWSIGLLWTLRWVELILKAIVRRGSCYLIQSNMGFQVESMARSPSLNTSAEHCTELHGVVVLFARR